MVLRNSAAEALQQHPHKVREAGGTGVAGLWSFIFPQSHKLQAASSKRQAPSGKLQASSRKRQAP